MSESIITGELVRELANSPAIDPALVCYDSDGGYGVRSTIRDADGWQPGNGYEVVATQATLCDYLDDLKFAEADADAIAAEWQANEGDRIDRTTDAERHAVAVENAQRSAAHALIAVNDRLGEPTADEVFEVAAVKPRAPRPRL